MCFEIMIFLKRFLQSGAVDEITKLIPPRALRIPARSLGAFVFPWKLWKIVSKDFFVPSLMLGFGDFLSSSAYFWFF